MGKQYQNYLVGLVLIFFAIFSSGCIYCGRSACVDADGNIRLKVWSAVANPSIYQSGEICEVISIFGDTHGAGGTILQTILASLTIDLTNQVLSIIDPVILQIPDDVNTFAGTYDDGNGISGSLATTPGLTSITMAPGQVLTPESGYQLVIVDFPADANLNLPTSAEGQEGKWFEFDFTCKTDNPRAIDIKIICAGKLELDGTTYYPPMFPAATSFTDVPAITIPLTNGAMEGLTTPSIDTLPDSMTSISYDFTDTTDDTTDDSNGGGSGGGCFIDSLL